MAWKRTDLRFGCLEFAVVLAVVIYLAALSLPAHQFEGRARAEDGKKKLEAPLALTILPGKGKDSSPLIDRDGFFHVLIENKSSEPIRIWSDRCQIGYENLSFLWNEKGEQPTRMFKRSVGSSNWRNQPSLAITIPAGGIHQLKVYPSGIWGERVWRDCVEPNSGQKLSLTAVLEIPSSDAASKENVWTGRIQSQSIETLVIEANLKTPHEYLWADCHRQALKLMKADPKWVHRRDDMDQTPLHLAARGDFALVVRWLLENGADPNARAYNKFTPLHFAHDPQVVQLLADHKADLNARDSSVETHLESVASRLAFVSKSALDNGWQAKERAVVDVLLKNGADYTLKAAAYLGDTQRARELLSDKSLAKDKQTMRAAVQAGKAPIVKLLLENGAEPEDADAGGLTFSYFGVEYPEVLKLLFAAGANPKVVVEFSGNGRGRGLSGSTLLHEAAERGAAESVKLLVEKGLDVNSKTPTGATPLCAACWEGHLEVVEVLLKHKADPKIATIAGWTPIGIAAHEIRPKHDEENVSFQAIIRALEKAGVETDIFAAIACDDRKRVEALIAADAKVLQTRNTNGIPALQAAVTLDRRAIVELLLANGCDPDIRSDSTSTGYKGETSLLNAAFWGRLELAELLIKKGADVNAKAERDIVPLHEAARMKHLELARLLLDHGAKVNAKCAKGETPLDWAQEYGEVAEMSALLRSKGGRLGRERGS